MIPRCVTSALRGRAWAINPINMSTLTPSFINGMNSRHLGLEDPKPVVREDRYTLYNMRFCPFAQRTALFLIAKNLPVDIVNINLKNKPSWFLDMTPPAKAPVLKRGSRTLIYESLVCDEFLEENHPESRKLFRDTPLDRAWDRIVVEQSKSFYGPLHRLARIQGQDDLVKVSTQVESGIQLLFEELQRRGTRFFGGTTPGVVDYSIWPWFERLAAFAQVTDLNWTGHPLETWVAAMETDESVRIYRINLEDHVQFLIGFSNGNQNYDIMYDKQSQISKL